MRFEFKTKLRLRVAAKRAWVGALRSGEYTQTSGCLRRLVAEEPTWPGHCCLGVAGDVLRIRYKPRQFQLPDTRFARVFTKRSLKAAEAAGETFAVDALQKFLVMLNDEADWSFSRIAEWIEKEL